MAEKDALFSFQAESLGGHTQVKIWAGKTPGSRGLCGELIMTNAEWRYWKQFTEDWAWIVENSEKTKPQTRRRKDD